MYVDVKHTYGTYCSHAAMQRGLNLQHSCFSSNLANFHPSFRPSSSFRMECHPRAWNRGGRLFRFQQRIRLQFLSWHDPSNANNALKMQSPSVRNLKIFAGVTPEHPWPEKFTSHAFPTLAFGYRHSPWPGHFLGHVSLHVCIFLFRLYNL